MKNFKDVKNISGLLFVASPTAYLITKGSQIAFDKLQDISNKEFTEDELKIKKMREEAELQEIIAGVSTVQARASQELAIAQRINTAHEVEIEEFYDTSKSGGLNANYSKGGVTGGLNAEGKNVTKRIYRFTGWHDGADEVYEQMIEDD